MNSDHSQIRVLLVGGGTGGHFYPLIALAESLNELSVPPRLYYAGPSPYDEESLVQQKITFVKVPAGKKRRYASIQNFFDSFKTILGIFVAIIKLYVIYPDVVFSKGGYTSVPVVLAAAFLRIPIIIHESDAVIGAANKLALRFAKHVIVAYDEIFVKIHHKGILKLGIPIRKELLQPVSQNAIENLQVDPNKPIILILGGSQGAERVNSLVLDTLDDLLTDFTVIHQTGAQNFEICTLSAERLIPDATIRANYHPVPFLTGSILNDAYHLAGVVISRAGSNSIYEIALHRKPAILIPIPEDISHDQRTNAYAYARVGGATVMEEGNLTDSLLRSEITRIMQNTDVYQNMSTSAGSFPLRDSAARVGDLVMEQARQH